MKLAIEFKGATVIIEGETRLDLSGLNAFMDTLTQTTPAQEKGWTAVIVDKKPVAKRRGRPKGSRNK